MDGNIILQSQNSNQPQQQNAKSQKRDPQKKKSSFVRKNSFGVYNSFCLPSLNTLTWQALYSSFKQFYDASISPQDLVDRLSSILQAPPYQFTKASSDKMAPILLADFTRFITNSLDDSCCPSSPQFILSYEDIQQLVSLAPSFQSNPDAFSLLVSFMTFARLNPHKSNWIKYDHKTIFYMGSASKFATSRQESLTSFLHTAAFLDMQVIGSNKPIPCFNIKWLYTQNPLDSQSNPLISLGQLTPKTIRDFSTSILLGSYSDSILSLS